MQKEQETKAETTEKQHGKPTEETNINPCSSSRSLCSNMKKQRIHGHGEAPMTTESAGGQHLGIRAREEERVATGHAAASTTHAPSGSPAQKEAVPASWNKTPLWRKAKHCQSCQGGRKGSYRAWIHPASRGKADRPAQGKRQGFPRGVDPPGKPRRSYKCSKHCTNA